MVSLNPGPSTLYAQVESWLIEILRSGVLSLPHRSPHFSEVYRQIQSGFVDKLGLPSDYKVLFVNSATECWSILTRSLTSNQLPAWHITTGTFSERWHAYALNEVLLTQQISLNPTQSWELSCIGLPQPRVGQLLCVTHTETSNGSCLPAEFTGQVCKSWQQAGGIVAVDATTSMAGVVLPWLDADIWFASVQKCFGLPPGLGVMVCSPSVSESQNSHPVFKGYNSLYNLLNNASHYQTVNTPNLTNIYLLGKLMAFIEPVAKIEARLKARRDIFYQTLQTASVKAVPYISPPKNRSITTLCIDLFTEENTTKFHHTMQKQGYYIGKGYGQIKDHTLRIANFPAVPDDSFFTMCEMLRGLVLA